MAGKRILKLSVVTTVIACGVLYGQRALVSPAWEGEADAILSQLVEPAQVSADARRTAFGGDGPGHPADFNGDGKVSCEFNEIGQGAVQAAVGLIEICHCPPGNLNNCRTITIDPAALPAHLAHGDTIGPCNDPGDPIFAFGLPHQPLGQAELFADPSGDLIITNIGDSGEDGVRIELTEVTGFHIDLFPATFPIGAQVMRNAIGTTGQSVGTLLTEQTDVGVALTPDFSGMGAPTFTVRLFNNGELVAVEEGVSGTGATILSLDAGLGQSYCFHPNALIGSLSFFSLPDFPWPTELPSGKTVKGDFILFTAEEPQIPIAPIQAIEVTAKNTSDLLIDGEWIILFDDHIPHRALGGARFQPTGGQLIVSDLEDASADGVRFDFIDFIVATQAEGGFRADLEGAALDAPGSEVALSARGTVNGVEDVPLGTASLENVEGVVQVFADYEPLGTDLVKVEMYQDGDFVGSITVPGGMVGQCLPFDGPIIIVVKCEKKHSPKPTDPPCFVYDFENPVVFEPGTLVGDELRLLAPDAPFPIESLQSFDLTSSVGEITIVDADILND